MPQPAKKSGIIAFVLLFMATVAVAFAVYLKSQGIDLKSISLDEIKEVLSQDYSPQEKAEGSALLYEIGFNEKDRPVFNVYRDIIVKCTRDYVKGLNKKGEELWSKDISLSKPLLKSNGSELLLADLDGYFIGVMSGKDIKWSEKLGDKLVNADISESGHVVAVQEGKSYRNVVKVFDPLGIEMFSRNIAENFVINASISPSVQQFVINSIDASGVEVTPSLEFFDMMGNPFAAKIPEQGMIFTFIRYLGDDSLAAASDTMLVYYDKNRSEKWRKTFDRIYSLDVLLGKYIAVASKEGKDRSNAGGSLTTVDIFNSKGQTVSSFEIDDEVVNVRAFEDLVAVNTGREVYFVNSRGKLTGKYSSKSDITEVYFFSKVEAAVITKTSIAVIRVN